MSLTGRYVRSNLNMPTSLPARTGGYRDYDKDCSITVFGSTQARLVGQSLTTLKSTLKESYDSILKIIIWCNRILLTRFNVQKTHYFSNTVHYCRSSMLRLSQTCRFLQSPSFWQAQSALIGQLTQCIVIGQTPQARFGNVMPLTKIASFSFQNKCKDS